jgi:hypothetical protein
MPFAVSDTDTREIIALFADENIARVAASALLRATYRPLSLVETSRRFTLGLADGRPPVARFIDGEEIKPTATIHPIVPSSEA